MQQHYYYYKCTDKKVTDKYLYVNNFGYTKDISNGQKNIRKEGRLDYQILYIDKGYIYFLINGKMEKIDSGHVVILHPEQPNYYIISQDMSTDFYWIHFTGYGVCALLKELHLEENVYKTGEFHEFIGTLETMMSIGAINNFFNDTYFSSYLHALLSETAKKVYYKNGVFDKVLLKMQNSTMDTLNNAELAKMCNMSESHFIRAFKKTTGKTPHQHMMKLTIDKAVELFSTTTMSVTEIALFLGFTDPLYFSKFFKKNIGMSPKKYIKEHTYRNNTHSAKSENASKK